MDTVQTNWLAKCFQNVCQIKRERKKAMASFMKFLFYKLDILASVNDLLPSFPCCCCFNWEKRDDKIKVRTPDTVLINDLDSKTAVEREKKRESKFSQPWTVCMKIFWRNASNLVFFLSVDLYKLWEFISWLNIALSGEQFVSGFDLFSHSTICSQYDVIHLESGLFFSRRQT